MKPRRLGEFKEATRRSYGGLRVPHDHQIRAMARGVHVGNYGGYVQGSFVASNSAVDLLVRYDRELRKLQSNLQLPESMMASVVT